MEQWRSSLATTRSAPAGGAPTPEELAAFAAQERPVYVVMRRRDYRVARATGLRLYEVFRCRAVMGTIRAGPVCAASNGRPDRRQERSCRSAPGCRKIPDGLKTSVPPDRPLRELALAFVKLGTTTFGGPAAHIAMMEDEVVRRRRWLTSDQFLDYLGATNLIPGPNSTELAIHIGRARAGGADFSWPGSRSSCRPR